MEMTMITDYEVARFIAAALYAAVAGNVIVRGRARAGNTFKL